LHFISDLISTLFEWIQSLGYFGIMIGLMIEVIPSEIVLAFGGFLVWSGDINFFGAVLFGTIGGVIAQIFVYWIGRYGGRPVLEKYGKYILIQKKHIDHSEEWFNKYGTGVIFTARFIPVVRHAISVPAGISRMPLGKFTLLTTLAVIPWSALFVYLGMTLGTKWEDIDEVAAKYTNEIILVALALIIIYFVYKWFKSKKRGTAK
jgi:membrane protein DedA with SNARE-associated domain